MKKKSEKQEIIADTREELDEAVNIHKENGWKEVSRRIRSDGIYVCQLKK